jgi:hypothetical protein
MKNKILVQEYLYDYSKDGGAIGEIVLSAKNGRAPLPAGAILKSVVARVITQCTSGGAATVSWGNGDSATGYSGTAIAVASLTANAIFNGEGNGASLLFDDAGDYSKCAYIDEETTTGKFAMTIADFALTAGKIVFICEYFNPAIDV